MYVYISEYVWICICVYVCICMCMYVLTYIYTISGNILNSNYYKPIKDSREHFVINTVIISAWSKVFVRTVLELFLTIVNCKEAVVTESFILGRTGSLNPSLLMIFLYMFYMLHIYYLFFLFLLCLTISHWSSKYELYSGGHFNSVLTVSLARQKTLLNSYRLGGMKSLNVMRYKWLLKVQS